MRPSPTRLFASLTQMEWPGNVRELRNAAERHFLGMDDEGPLALPEGPRDAPSLEEQMEIAERRVIHDTLTRMGGRVGATAEALGITRKTLYLKMKKYDLGRMGDLEA